MNSFRLADYSGTIFTEAFIRPSKVEVVTSQRPDRFN